ncbi:MAG TPA: aa3-type cytochrome c oxidase subunit IV [Caulobacteraceae bacterium]|nr:aa3-type cytochrome c oxidase subunit IV [Caulobacteraceae bacterium]
MAEQHVQAYEHGDMDIQAHQASFHAFMLMAKWGSLHVATLLVFLVMWFCTSAGFIPALIAAVVVAVLGNLALRDRTAAGH